MTRSDKITALEKEFHSTVDDLRAAFKNRALDGVEECIIHALSLAKAIAVLEGKPFPPQLVTRH